MNSVGFSPDGHTLASGSHDGMTRLWNLNVHYAIGRICVAAGASRPVSGTSTSPNWDTDHLAFIRSSPSDSRTPAADLANAQQADPCGLSCGLSCGPTRVAITHPGGQSRVSRDDQPTDSGQALHPDQRQPEHPGRSIGAICRGCPDKLRRHPATAALINTEADSTRSEINGQAMVH